MSAARAPDRRPATHHPTPEPGHTRGIPPRQVGGRVVDSGHIANVLSHDRSVSVLEIQYYVDLPGRDLSICDPGSVVWVDIEPGCFQDADDVRAEGTRITEAGLRYGTYCNQTSLTPVFGSSNELSLWPLWYADYRPPDYSTFVPFNGWTEPALWQWSSGGYRIYEGVGVESIINCDMSITPDGRLFADISNFTTLTKKQADYLKYTLSGVVIGLQDAAKARHFKELLSD